MAEVMTDKQFKTILEMVDMILDGCKDLEEAKKKVQKLIENQGGKEKTESFMKERDLPPLFSFDNIPRQRVTEILKFVQDFVHKIKKAYKNRLVNSGDDGI